jgi:phosphate transport system substrate-binding protein
MPCIEKSDGCVKPSVDTAVDRSYPIARPLLMYTDGEPKGAVKQYLDWVKSKNAQCIISAKGYAPSSKVSCK